MRAFPKDFVAHLEGTLTPPRHYRLPKIVDLGQDTVTRHQNRPETTDWTYIDERRAG